jgi:hypothetical protein
MTRCTTKSSCQRQSAARRATNPGQDEGQQRQDLDEAEQQQHALELVPRDRVDGRGLDGVPQRGGDRDQVRHRLQHAPAQQTSLELIVHAVGQALQVGAVHGYRVELVLPVGVEGRQRDVERVRGDAGVRARRVDGGRGQVQVRLHQIVDVAAVDLGEGQSTARHSLASK